MNNNDIVFDIIKRSKKHLTAYEILDKLQKVKKTQPMTVYRALSSLKKEERIHKSNQTKTFMLCNHLHSKNTNGYLYQDNLHLDTHSKAYTYNYIMHL